MDSQWNSVSLAHLAVLRVSGEDRVPYLQGQLSNDVARLTAARSLPAGLHNPQGRVVALVRLIEGAGGDVLVVLPRELAAQVAARLRKFILRARVVLADDSERWQLTGLIAPHAAARAAPLPAPTLPETLHAVAPLGAGVAVRVAAEPARWLLLTPLGAPALAGVHAAPAVSWERLAVAAGEPEVYTGTSEQFVAQMLNLDALGAIAFDKGCYTGQEVIARAHYRGRVKRRMQRFLTRAAAALSAGDAGELPDGRAFRVVRAAALEDGRCEFLAVAALPAAEAGPAAERSAGTPLEAAALPLPYPLPE